MKTLEGGLQAGVSQFATSSTRLLARPAESVAWLAAAPVGAVLQVVWGGALGFHGWVEARRHLREEGLAGLGEALAPALARAQYADGVFRGLWRVHTLSLALSLVLLPTTLLAMVPAFLASLLLQPTQGLLPPLAGFVFAFGIPGVLALCAATVLGGHAVLTLRLLAAAGTRASLGLVFAASGAAWRVTLRHLPALAGIGLLFAAAALVVGVIVRGSLSVAMQLQLGAGGAQLVTTWTAAALGLTLLALGLEAIAAWAEGVEAGSVAVEAPYSFTAWLVAWIAAAVAWLEARGIVAIGVAVALFMGLATAAASLVTGAVFTSGVALGWFAVTAAVLVALSFRRRG